MKDKNYDFFVKNFEDLYQKYKDKFIVIKEEVVIGVYDTFDDAYNSSIKVAELGTFLIQQCSKAENTVGNFYSNNVVFA